MASTANPAEVEKFDALAARWWDPRGPMAPLHAMNPCRMGWIAARLPPLPGLRVLDVGCGAGLASEWLSARGAVVTGLDAAGQALAAARAHAAAAGLAIDYRDTPVEAMEGKFDAVLALEVVEHVADRAAFCAALAARVRPGGAVFLSTLNRTARSFALAKIGAEYVLRLLPVGTHDWSLFVRPSELGADLRSAGLRITALAGMTMAPLSGEWRITRDVGVNYLAMAVR